MRPGPPSSGRCTPSSRGASPAPLGSLAGPESTRALPGACRATRACFWFSRGFRGLQGPSREASARPAGGRGRGAGFAPKGSRRPGAGPRPARGGSGLGVQSHSVAVEVEAQAEEGRRPAGAGGPGGGPRPPRGRKDPRNPGAGSGWAVGAELGSCCGLVPGAGGWGGQRLEEGAPLRLFPPNTVAARDGLEGPRGALTREELSNI